MTAITVVIEITGPKWKFVVELPSQFWRLTCKCYGLKILKIISKNFIYEF